MSVTLIVLLVVAIGALLSAAGAWVTIAQRREVLERAAGDDDVRPVAKALRPIAKERPSRVWSWLEGLVPESSAEDEGTQEGLVRAGIDSQTAPASFFLVRVIVFVAVPLATIAIVPRSNITLYLLFVVISVFMAFVGPLAVLDRLVQQRQERIRRSVPDALDLLVVCVEAGVSLDAAILRVAREIRLAHPDLAHELAVVNRKTNAGIPRDTALRGLWQRTGVEEIRTLVSSMIQSEKWGTSIATVLRVSAESLRRKRRQAAEKKAKMAPLKMTFPLILFIMPALFIVIMGPAIVQIIREFGKI
jgi:tight adherence protein C